MGYPRHIRPLIVFVILITSAISASWSPAQAAQDDSKESFLVATRQLVDPIFHHTVIVRIPSPEPPLVAGLIVNKPSELKIEEVFPHDPGLKGHTDKAFFGGPVGITTPILLTRGSGSADSAKVFGDIYMTADPESIAKVLKLNGKADKARLILGRAQWSRDQLRAEIAEGSWYIVPGTADILFSSDVENLWHTLVHRAQVEEANADSLDEWSTLPDYALAGFPALNDRTPISGFDSLTIEDLGGGFHADVDSHWATR